MSSFCKTSVSTLAIFLALGTTSSVAWAADPPTDYDTWYVSVFGGYNMARVHASFETDHYDIRMKDGFSVGMAVGSYVADGVRLERELSYARNGNKSARYAGDDDYAPQSGNMSGVFLMTNMWKDFRTSDRLQPYVGGGLGVALLSGKGDGETDPYDFSGELALAVQAGAGVRYAMTDRLALDVGYRYRGAIDASHGPDPITNGAFSYYTHTVQAGLTYAFRDGGVVMPSSTGDSGAYLSVFGGAAMSNKTAWEYEGTIYALNQKNGFTVGAAIGTQLAPGLRGEAELSYLRSKLTSVEFDSGSTDPASGTLNQTYFLFNLWKDFDLGMLSPYIGGGIGFGMASFDNGVADGDELSNKSGVGIAGQFGFGARVPVTDALKIDVGYRFKSIVDAMIVGDNDYTYNYDIATRNHIIQAGATYAFGGSASSEPSELTNKYVSVFGGLAMPVDTHFNYDGNNYIADFKTGFTVGAAVGGNINDKLRGELELSFVNGNATQVFEEDDVQGTGGKVDGYYAMANLWRDMDLGGFNPYLGGGVGLALMDVDIDLADNDRNTDSTVALAAQLGTGVRFDVTDKLTLDAGYRLKAAIGAFTGGTDGGDHTMASYYTHVGQVGVSWKF